MKILHAYIDFDPFRGGGGVARHIHGLSVELVKAGHVVKIVASATEPFDGIYSVYKRNWFKLIQYVKWADVVHVHGARKVFPFIVALLAIAYGRRIIYTPYCYYDDIQLTMKQICKYIWDRTAEYVLLSRSDAVILLCEHWRDYLKKRHLPFSHTTVVPNCVVGEDVLALLPSNTPPALAGNPSILSVGRLDSVKMLDDVIAALRLPELQEAVFHIVGKGPDAARLQSEARKHKVDDRVIFHGFISDAEVAMMALGTGVFVLPSMSEGQPTVLIEMLLWGVPVACSRIPGNEAITDVVGLDCTFEVGDLHGLSQVILRFSGQHVSKAVREKVIENFTWEKVAYKIANLYSGENLPHA